LFQDLGGGPTLFGIASIINHVAELLAYFFSNKILLKFGYAKILYMGLSGNVLRFLYISFIIHPWWVLPVEVFQGDARNYLAIRMTRIVKMYEL
jgi:hypothetical protein